MLKVQLSQTCEACLLPSSHEPYLLPGRIIFQFGGGCYKADVSCRNVPTKLSRSSAAQGKRRDGVTAGRVCLQPDNREHCGIYVLSFSVHPRDKLIEICISVNESVFSGNFIHWAK